MALLYLKHILFDMLPSAELKARGQLLSISNHLEMIHDTLWAINSLVIDGQLQVCFMEILRKNHVSVEKAEVEGWVKEVDLGIVDSEELLSRILLWKPARVAEASIDNCSSSNYYFFQSALDGINRVLFPHFILTEVKEMAYRLNYLRRRGYALSLRREMLDCMHPLQEDYGNVLRDEVVGREKDKINIINILEQKQQRPIKTSIIIIENKSPFFKTDEIILTHMIYHDHWVHQNFKYRIWVDVSNIWNIDCTRILEEILRSIKGEGHRMQKKENANWLTLKDLLGNDRYLLVLNEYNYFPRYINQWKKLKDALVHLGGAGSAAIITLPFDTTFDESEKDIGRYSLGRISEEMRKELVRKQIAGIQPIPDQLQEAHTVLFDLWNKEFTSLTSARIAGAMVRCCKMKGWSAAAAAAASGPLPWRSLYLMKERFFDIISSSLGVGRYGVLSAPLSIYQSLLRENITYEDYRLDYFKDTLNMCEAEGFLHSSITHYLPTLELYRTSFFEPHSDELRLRWSLCLRVGEEEDAGIRIPPHCLYLCLLFLGIPQRRSFSTGINKRLRALVILDERQREDRSSSRLLPEDRLVHKIMKDIFKKLKCLCILYIQSIRIRQMPKRLRRLHNLRYLKLSGMEIRTLPKSLCNLHNLKILSIDHCEQLQKLPERIDKLVNLSILKIRYCTRLQKLPKSIFRLVSLEELDVQGSHWLIELPEGLEKMKNLRVLDMAECASLTKIPIKIGRMSRLEILSGLITSYDDDDGTGSRCVIHELQELTSLRTLELQNLEQVSKIEEDIRRINLQDKGRLEKLSLHWECRNIDEDEYDAVVGLQVIEALKPDSEHLKSLRIISYQGQDFPSWIGFPNTGVLDYLIEIKLINLRKCKRLPPLGHLPFLETIEISGMDLIRIVNDKGTFPKLSFLILSEMPVLEEWKWKSVQELHLKELTLIQCPKFKGFHQPGIIGVHQLNIWLNNGTLWTSSSFWNSFIYVDYLEIVGCHELRFLPLDMQQQQLKLCKLIIISCNNLEALPDWLLSIFDQWRRTLYICSCATLSVVPQELEEGLIDIKVERCPKLCSF